MEFIKDFFENFLDNIKSDSNFRNKVIVGGVALTLIVLTFWDSGDGAKTYEPRVTRSQTMFTSNTSSEKVKDERMRTAYEALQTQSREMKEQMDSINRSYSTEREQFQSEMDSMRLEMESMRRQLELAASKQSQFNGVQQGSRQSGGNQQQAGQSAQGLPPELPPVQLLEYRQSFVQRNQNIISAQPLMGKGLRIVSQSRELTINGNGQQEVVLKGEELKRNEQLAQLESQQVAEDEEAPVFLPAGSMITGTVITGVNADISPSTASSPPPIMIRVTEEVLTPGGYYIDLRGCNIIAGVVGSLKDRRGKVRAEVLSCMRDDGKAIEQGLVAFGSGSDGLEGVRGKLVHNADEMLTNTIVAGTLGGFADAIRPQNIPGLQTTPGSDSLFQAPDPGEVTGIAALNGAGDSMERLSEYWIALAEQSLPYIEIQAGRKIDLIVQRGLSLEVKG